MVPLGAEFVDPPVVDARVMVVAHGRKPSVANFALGGVFDFCFHYSSLFLSFESIQIFGRRQLTGQRVHGKKVRAVSSAVPALAVEVSAVLSVVQLLTITLAARQPIFQRGAKPPVTRGL